MSARRRGLAVVAGAVAALAVIAVLDPAAAARGWLVAFLIASACVIGGAALALIAQLTGARWAVRVRPLARAAPALFLLWIPAAVGLAQIYPWTGAAGRGHAAAWLAEPVFIVRDLAALAIWGGIGALAASGRIGRLTLGLALLVHGLLVSFAGTDWVLSLRPGWVSSNFGMNLAAQQIGAAAAAAILVSGRDAPEDQLRDLTSLAIAAGLGVAYLAFMDFLIVWYGNLPGRVGWYVARQVGAAPWIVGAAMALAVAIPAAAAAPKLSRRSKARTVAVMALGALGLYQLYLTWPLVGLAVVVSATLALLVQAGVLALTAAALDRPLLARGLAHG